MTFATGLGGSFSTTFGNRNRSYTTQTTAISPSSVEFGLGDIDGDGHTDIVSVDYDLQSLRWQKGHRDGTFGSQITLRSGLYSGPVIVSDFDGNGAADVLVGNSSATAPLFFGQQSKQVSGLGAFNVASTSAASNLLTILDSALDALNTQASKVSAVHSRLDSAAASQLLLSDTLSEAKDRAQSVDFALETAEVVRLQILQQAQTSVYAHSTVNSLMVLKLLESLNQR